MRWGFDLSGPRRRFEVLFEEHAARAPSVLVHDQESLAVTAMMKACADLAERLEIGNCSGAAERRRASALGAARFAAQFDASEIRAGQGPRQTRPEVNGIRCSTGCIGAEVRSKPPSEPTPEARPISSTGEGLQRTADSARGGMIPPENPPLPEPWSAALCQWRWQNLRSARAHERLTNRVAREIVDKLRAPEAHLDFAG